MCSWCSENFQSSLSTRSHYFPTFLVHDTIVLSSCTKRFLCPVNDVVWASQIKVKFHYKQHHVWHSRVLKHYLGFQSSEFSFQFCHRFMWPSLLRWWWQHLYQEWAMQPSWRTVRLAWASGGRVRRGPLANQPLVFTASCSVSQLSIGLFPLHTL